MSYAFEPLITAVPIIDSHETFPVRRIYCVGRNYAEHAIEMGHCEREAPFFFTKPADAVVVNPKSIHYPSITNELHYEVELVIAIAKTGFEIELSSAWEHVFGCALGIDLTKRDLQTEYKKKSRPWDLAKGFDQSAPVSSIIAFKEFGELNEVKLQLSIDDEIKQSGNINQMIWSIPEIIVELSRHIELKSGDLIFSGTPSGVGEIKKGQTVSATMNAARFDLNLNFTVY
ncbi:fumarylacetoacetate hydrolase family protein [Kangiella sp. HZ709]|uniref:fumarylacetoacetate hydrolase family protein n=1 Tax=Kangiella sp. HZ709 TaxID=2666328 RepID=UPI0012B15E06|nr:fumarylacetoacetate hydrolase family protein [Kangiella sp. HZ709]MRX27516.1 FAA hydrolase family protein [Kangiella sp. HZ709]